MALHKPEGALTVDLLADFKVPIEKEAWIFHQSEPAAMNGPSPTESINSN